VDSRKVHLLNQPCICDTRPRFLVTPASRGVGIVGHAISPMRSRCHDSQILYQPACHLLMVWDAVVVRSGFASRRRLTWKRQSHRYFSTPVAVAAPSVVAYSPAPRSGCRDSAGNFNETPPVESATASLQSDQLRALPLCLQEAWGLCSVLVQVLEKSRWFLSPARFFACFHW